MDNFSLDNVRLNQAPTADDIDLAEALDNHQKELFDALVEAGMVENPSPEIKRFYDCDVYMVRLKNGKHLIYRISNAEIEHALYKRDGGYEFHDFENNTGFPTSIDSFIIEDEFKNDPSFNTSYIVREVLGQQFED